MIHIHLIIQCTENAIWARHSSEHKYISLLYGAYMLLGRKRPITINIHNTLQRKVKQGGDKRDRDDFSERGYSTTTLKI